MKFHTRDWLDNKELRRCSPTSRAILVDLMCLAAEGTLYGYLCDKVGPLSQSFMAARCFVSQSELDASIEELLKCERLHRDDKGLYISRMVRDEEIRVSRAEGGKLSIGHPNTPKKGTLPIQNNDTHVLKTTSRERTCADSDSGSSSAVLVLGGSGGMPSERQIPSPMRFPEWIAPWPRCASPDAAAQSWLSVVTSADTESAAFAARDRYLASDEVSRGAIMEPSKWLFSQARANWAGVWPAARKQNGSNTEELAASIEAFRRTR